MIGYVTLGSNDLEKAAEFYDAVLGELGAKRAMEMETFISWSTSPKAPSIAISKPFDGEAATVGNGCMTAIFCDKRAKVDAVYNKAIEMGGTCEGEPGPRGNSGFYAAYFRDRDGNKLNAFTMSKR